MSLKLRTFIILSLLILLGCADGGGSSDGSPGAGPGNGQGGSRARFAIAGDILYILNDGKMQLFDIKEPATPTPMKEIDIAFDIETIFAYQDKLLIGSETGVVIFDNSDPTTPTYKSEFSHVRSCDPVVVQGANAFVTLRSQLGGRCQTGENRLDILDINVLEKPTLIASLAMTSPSGLGVEGAKLFVCDGTAGLKMYDIRNLRALKLMATEDVDCYDVIPQNGRLIVSAQQGILQYDSRGQNLALISHLALADANVIDGNSSVPFTQEQVLGFQAWTALADPNGVGTHLALDFDDNRPIMAFLKQGNEPVIQWHDGNHWNPLGNIGETAVSIAAIRNANAIPTVALAHQKGTISLWQFEDDQWSVLARISISNFNPFTPTSGLPGFTLQSDSNFLYLAYHLQDKPQLTVIKITADGNTINTGPDLSESTDFNFRITSGQPTLDFREIDSNTVWSQTYDGNDWSAPIENFTARQLRLETITESRDKVSFVHITDADDPNDANTILAITSMIAANTSTLTSTVYAAAVNEVQFKTDHETFYFATLMPAGHPKITVQRWQRGHWQQIGFFNDVGNPQNLTMAISQNKLILGYENKSLLPCETICPPRLSIWSFKLPTRDEYPLTDE